MAIFQKSVVEKFLSELEESVIDSAYSRFKEVYSNIEAIKKLKEEQYQEGFIRDIFVYVLGYTLQPESNYNIELEKKNETDSKKADGAILKDGKMDQDDLPADILLNPKTDYVKKFVEDVNRSRVLKAKHIMQKLNGEDITKAIKVNENDFIEKFIDRVVEEKPEMIVVQDKQNKNVGCISSKRLSEILKK